MERVRGQGFCPFSPWENPVSDSDSFIEEVTEEVRRDRLFALMRRYGWIAILAIVLLVGGAAFNEYRKAQAKAEAEALGDSILSALDNDDPAARRAALDGVDAGSPGGDAVLTLLKAAGQANAEENTAAAETLNALATNGDVPEIYRQIAAFKALTLASESLSAQERRTGFEALAAPGAPLRLLSEEQLALIDIEDGQTDAAVTRLRAILQDAELTAGLRQRATQLIVALGADPAPVSEG